MELKPLVASMLFTALLGAAPQTFAALRSMSPGYVYDGAGQVVYDGEGNCVRTSDWSPQTATVQCDPQLFKHADATPNTKPAPKAAAQTYRLVPVAAVWPKAATAPKPEKLTLFSDFKFGFDKATLTKRDKEKLDDLIDRDKAWPEVTTVRITGYTDNVGRPAYNKELSLRRAEAAQNYLIDHGIDPQRIVIAGMGAADPVASNATPAGRAQNRRAEVDMRAIDEDVSSS